MKHSKLRQLIQEELRLVKEDYSSKLYKIEGLLITSTKKKTQSQILSDIRSIPGITTIDAREYTPRLPKPNREYDILTIKVDPYPYTKNGNTFDLETINQIITDINSIRGIIKFKVDNPQLINIGI
jgi:hypothetical protein